MRSLPQTEAFMGPQAAIHFDSGLKVLRAEIAPVRPCRQCQRPTDTDRVAELKRLVPDVLFRNEILRERPTPEVTSQDQFGLDLPLLLRSSLGVQTSQVSFAIIVHDFKQALIRTVNVLEFHVEHRINPMLAGKNPKPILPTVPSKERALACRGLPIKVHFRGPPRPHAVLKFQGGAKESVSACRLAGYVLDCNLQVARFLHLVGVGNEEWAFGSRGTRVVSTDSCEHQYGPARTSALFSKY